MPKLARLACKGTPRPASEILNCLQPEGARGLSGVAESGIALSWQMQARWINNAMRFVKLAAMAT